MSFFRGVFALAILSLISSFSADAQVLSGKVSSTDGSLLAGTSVTVVDSRTGNIMAGTASDSNGEYEFRDLLPGRFRVTASFVGLSSSVQIVSIETGDNLILDFILSSSTVRHDEMVISARRSEETVTPATITNITAEELANSPAMKDLPVHLSTAPSVTFYSENGNGVGYSTLRMRGFDQRRIAIAINGIPQNDPEEFNVFWINFYDIQGVIRDIQIQRGAGGAYYGSPGIGGAINIITGPYQPNPELEIETGAGSFGTRQLSVAANSGIFADKYRAFTRVSRLESDGYRNGSWTEFWRVFFGLQRISSRSTVTLQAYGGPQRDGLAYSGIPKAANDASVDDGFGGTIDRKYNYSSLFNELEDFHQPHLELHHSFNAGANTIFEQSLFYIKGEGYFDFDGSFRSANYLDLPQTFVPSEERDDPLFLSSPTTSVLFRAYLDQWQLGWLPRITYESRFGKSTVGTEARIHQSLRWGRVQESNEIPAGLVGDSDARVYSFRGEKIVGSVLGSHVYQPSSRYLVQADVSATWRRYRIFDDEFFNIGFRTPYTFVNPRVGVTLNPGAGTSGYFSAALTTREPRMKSHFDGEEAGAGFLPQFERDANGAYDFSGPLVRPERMYNLESGINLRNEGYRFSANAYLMYFVDEIVPSGGLDQFGVPRTGNADKTIHIGLESEINARLYAGLDLQANLAVSRNRFQKFTEYDEFTGEALDRAGNPIAGFPNITSNVAMTYSKRGATLRVSSQFVGSQNIDNSGAQNADGVGASEFEVDPYSLTNATLIYRFESGSRLSGLEASLDVNNVFDSKVLTWGNVSFGSPQFFPYATRHVYLKMKYTLK